jgi:hypothetical protein
MVYTHNLTTGTKSMLRHIQSECKVNRSTLAEKPVKLKESVSNHFKREVPKVKQEEFNQTLVKGLAKDLRPFNLVKGAGFRSIAAALVQIGAKYGNVDVSSFVCHPSTLKRKHLEQVFTQLQDNVSTAVKNGKCYPGLSFTSDMWTNTFNQDHFLSLTAHFFDDLFELKSFVLAVRKFPEEKKTIANIRNEIHTILREYFGDDSQQVIENCYGVTDSGANMLGVFENQFPCQCHILNLVLEHTFAVENYTEDQLLPIGNLISSAKCVVTYFKQTGLNSKLSSTLKQAVSTRWNSNLIMLESLLKAMPEVKSILCERSQLHRLQCINEEHLSLLVHFLKPFRDCSEELSREKVPTSSNVLVWYKKLEVHLDPTSEDNPLLLKLKNITLVWFHSYCDGLDDIYYIATMLNPRFVILLYLK